MKHIWNACLAIRNIKESTNSGLFLVKLTQDVEIEETAAEVISNVLAKGYFVAMAKQGASQDCERRPFKEKKKIISINISIYRTRKSRRHLGSALS